MRKSLLECFDKIYILDLHGNSKKKEVCPDGSPDQNVFDIMQGVSINLLIKTGTKKENKFGTIFNFDLFGTRENKYKTLIKNDLYSLKWVTLNLTEPNYFFVHKDFNELVNYTNCINLNNLFLIHTSGIKTHDDNNLIDSRSFGEFNQIYFY